MNPFFKQIQWLEENFHEILTSSEVVIDMKYATSDNFMAADVYQGFQRCFVSEITHKKFSKACETLRLRHPQLRFRIWDALRPRSIQSLFFDHLKGTAFQDYVAAPYPGSLHNFGMALDLTLERRDGSPLDMGTGFDDFRELAQPRLESKFLATGELTSEQYENRLLLRNLLEEQGFTVLEHEWWHFNALPKSEVHGKFPVFE